MNSNDKKEYQRPELIEWGSITELTQGSATTAIEDGVIGSVGASGST